MKWKNNSLLILLTGTLLVSCEEPSAFVEAVPVDSAALNYLVQSPAHTVLSQQTVIRFGDSISAPMIDVTGYIIPDERRTNNISARVNGRIEKLYVRFPYEYVQIGQKLMDIYSPDLTTAISEHIFLFEQDSTSSLTKESRLKLERLGLTRRQLLDAEKTLTAPSSISIYSAYEGYNLPISNSTQTMQRANSSPFAGMSGMNNVQGGQDITSSSVIREGSYFTIGQKLFSLNDGAVVIGLLNIPTSGIAEGSAVQLTAEARPDSILYGTLSVIEPTLRNEQKFLLGRVELKNTMRYLGFNSLVNGKVSSVQRDMRNVPASCVYDLGTRKIVWVKTGMIENVAVFIPRIVITGITNNEQTEIIAGLNPGEEIALQAGLMTDREGIIQTSLK